MRPGDLFANRFELDRLAGMGGMGVVWRALDRSTGEPVALKLILHLRADYIARFQREARVLAEFQHPRIARHIAHGTTDDGQRYLAMEWLDGEDLEARLARGPLGIDESLALVGKVADALTAVHARGIVHRDLKPANLWLVGRRLEHVKLLDFGIARLTDATYALTDPGAPIGTPAYMAPEQVRSDPDIDASADIYALGCLLFECLTGRPPFVADHLVALLAKVMFDEPPRPGALRPGVPAGVDALVALLLAKGRAARPKDAATVAAALLRAHDTGAIGSAMAHPQALTKSERRLISVVVARASDPGHGPLPELSLSPVPLEEKDTWDAGVTSSRQAHPDSLLAELQSAARVHRAHLEVMRDGSVVAIVTSAGAPTDLAAKAARCALAIRTLLAGPCVALATGWDVIDGSQPIGQVIDRAGALLAAPSGSEPPNKRGPVRLDPMTVALLGPRFEISEDELGPVLADEREPLEEARTLLGRPIPCVGRDRELRNLQDVFDECVTEPCAQAVLVTAAAGMGKSRLRQDFLRRLQERGAPPEIWIAYGDALRAGAPLSLLGQIVRRAAQLVDGETLVHRREKLAARVARFVDGAERDRVTEFLGEIVSTPFPDGESVQLRAARQDPLLMGDQTRRAWLDFLRAECLAHPVVLVLEDLHWGDLPSIDYMDAALRLLRDRALLVLALARGEVREVFPSLWADRRVTELRLGELSPRACERLARMALGEQVPAERIAEIVRRAAGHAFFLEELVRAAAEDRDMRAVPETVLAMVQVRLERLDAESRRVLRAASVLGEVFWRGALAQLLAVGKDDPELAERLSELERREWIAQQPAPRFHGEVEYMFRHALVCETAYGMLTEADRQLGHRLAGAWLEQAGEKDAAVLAEHFARGGDLGAAGQHFGRAAEQALEANDLGGVIARVTRALSCKPGRETVGRLQVLAATAHNWRGMFEEGERAAKTAVELADAGSRAQDAALSMLVWASGALGKAEQLEVLASSLPLGWQAAALDRDLLLSWYGASTWLRRAGRCAAADALDRSMAHVEPAELEPSLGAPVYATRAFAESFSHRIESALHLAEAAFSSYERSGDLRNACLMQGEVGLHLTRLGAYADAELVSEQSLLKSVAMDVPYVVCLTKHVLGQIYAIRGDVERARPLLVDAVKRALPGRNIELIGFCRIRLARILARLGEVEEAYREAREAAHVAVPFPQVHATALSVVARVCLGQRRLDEALEAVTRAFEIATALGRLELDDAYVHLTHAEVLHACGAHDAARSVITTARNRLCSNAEEIRSPDLRRSFLGDVPEHMRIFELSRSWSCLESRGP
jgi:eukaryotic-like serine/threonine-protein kinase